MNRFLMLALTTFALSTVSWSAEPEIKDAPSSSPRLSAGISLTDSLIVNPTATPPADHHDHYSGLLPCIGGEGGGAAIISQQEIENISAQYDAGTAEQSLFSAYRKSTMNKILPLVEKWGTRFLSLIEIYGPVAFKRVDNFFQKHSDLPSIS